MSKLFVFAESGPLGIAYCRRNNFKIGTFEVLSKPMQLRAYPKPHNVLLVGNVSKREDYEDLLEVLEELNAKVERLAV